MAKRLTQSEETPTIALIGQLGSGKSTIGHFLSQCLHERHDTHVVPMSLWPFDSVEAAVRGIVQAIVDKLGRHVNALSIRGLSEDYIRVIQTAGGQFSDLAQLLRKTAAPKAILDEASDIAQAIGIRIVLWIEDLERFAGTEQLNGDNKVEHEVERLRPIRALLYLLDQCPHISVVISDTSLRTRFDLGKLARYIERVPQLETAQVWRIVKQLRDRCLNGYPCRIIDPTASKVRKDFEPPENPVGDWEWFWQFDDRPKRNVFRAVVEALRTPRALKNALRWTLELWETMPGEIDFDDVLVANSIKAAHPELFAIIDEHRALFRSGFRNPLTSFEKDAGTPPDADDSTGFPLRRDVLIANAIRDASSQISARLDNSIRGHGPGNPLVADEERTRFHPILERIDRLFHNEELRTARALNKLLGHLSPQYVQARDPAAARDEETDVENSIALRPQALFFREHTDYWQRYLVEPEISSEESDQTALKDIDAWRNRKKSTLIGRVLDESRGGQIVPFVNQFTHKDLCRLLEEAADQIVKAPLVEWSTHHPGIWWVRQIMLQSQRRPLSKNRVYATTTGIVKSYSEKYLPLVHDIVKLFASAETHTPNFMLPDQAEKVRRDLRESLPKHFTGEGAERRLADALQGGRWNLIRSILWNESGRGAALPDKQWPDFARTLLDLAESQPLIGIPQTAALVTRFGDIEAPRIDEDGVIDENPPRSCEFHDQAAEHIFDKACGELYQRLLQVLADCKKSSEELSEDENVRACCRAAIDGAKERLHDD